MKPKCLDLSMFKQYARDDLSAHLNYFDGGKDLFLDEELMKPFDLISGATFLKQNGVEKIYKLQLGGVQHGSSQRIFIVRPYANRMRLIADIINFDKAKEIERSYHIVLTPKRLTTCDLILEQEGIYGDVTIAEYTLDFFQLDEDLLSLEMPLCYKQFYLENDTTWYNSIARSVVTLQETYGIIHKNYCLGSMSKTVFDLMQMMFSNERASNPPDVAEIASLFLIDRDMDYASMLCSQLTYEGLVAETFGIKSGIVEFDKDVIKSEQSSRLNLNSSDRVFKEIRGLHISSIFPLLSQKAKLIQCGYDKRNDLDSVQDLKQFVSEDLKRLKQEHKSLALHIGACEAIMSKRKIENFEDCLHVEQCLLDDTESKECISYIETCINRQTSALNCLRLLCLLSVCKGGLDNKSYKSLKLQYLQSFGYQHLLTFKGLQDAGLYTETTDKRNSFPKVRKKFNLIPKDPEVVSRAASPTDVSYVFGGAYTPFIIKLVEQVILKGLSGPLEESLKALSLNSYEFKQGTTARQQKGEASSGKTVLVVFLAGCTHTEVNALRFLGDKLGYRFVILTTAVLTAADILTTLT